MSTEHCWSAPAPFSSWREKNESWRAMDRYHFLKKLVNWKTTYSSDVVTWQCNRRAAFINKEEITIEEEEEEETMRL